MSDFETVNLSACRTPFGALGGMFTDVSAVDPGAVAIREAVARASTLRPWRWARRA
jgi:acetyl-CoA acetyltransferase